MFNNEGNTMKSAESGKITESWDYWPDKEIEEKLTAFYKPK